MFEEETVPSSLSSSSSLPSSSSRPNSIRRSIGGGSSTEKGSAFYPIHSEQQQPSLLQGFLSSNSLQYLPTINSNEKNSKGGSSSNSSSSSDGDSEIDRENNETKNANFGTFEGVYVPCLLGIYGVILFERLPWVIGQAGFLLSLVMMLFALGVVIPTVLSVSAIATNGNMKGGGAYFMISRSLGPELGGSVGLIFFTAYVIAGGVFTIGFVEGFQEAFDVPDSSSWTLLYGSVTLAAMIAICFIGAEFYAKSAVAIFIVLVFSLICGVMSLLFEEPGRTEGYTSWNWDTLSDNLSSNFNDEPDGQMQDFHSIFAIFFPAMTGIMAGANMSGDLAKPASSIPKGTLWAIFTASCTYFTLMLLFAATFETYRLQEEYFVFPKVAFNSFVISIGIFAATLSSVLGSIIGCGNILYALAQDDLLPLGFLNTGSPRRAILITWFLMQCTLFINELNTMATLQTMFFLFSYGIVNFACLTLILTGAPNFRPTWPYFNIWTCGLGVTLCFGGMFYVDSLYASLSLLTALIVFVFILFRQPSTNWGDVSQAIMYHQVRKYLLRLDPRKEHVKFWRPQVLLFIPNESLNYIQTNWPLLDFINNLKKGGLYVIANVIIGQFDHTYEYVQKLTDGWTHLIDEGKLKAFPSVTVAPSLRLGFQNLISTAGVGMLKPNTIIIPFPFQNPSSNDPLPQLFSKFPQHRLETNQQSDDEFGNPENFVDLIRDSLMYKKNVILTRHFEILNKELIIRESRKSSTNNIMNNNNNDSTMDSNRTHSRRALSTRSFFNENSITSSNTVKTIDLWLLKWSGEDDSRQTSTITLLLLLGHILQKTDIWRKHTKLRVLGYVSDRNLINEKTRQLKNFLLMTRINAEILVVPLDEIDSLPDTLIDPGHSSINPKTLSSTTTTTTTSDSIPRSSQVDHLDELFLKLNLLLRSQLTRSSILFLPFPTPPPKEEGPERSISFMRHLTILTDNLPPTVLLHSVSGSVITSDL